MGWRGSAVKIIAMLTMQKTMGSAQVVEYRCDILDYPGENRRVSRADILKKMMDRMPDSVRDGAILFFSAQSEYIS
jgi:hypothetical protein